MVQVPHQFLTSNCKGRLPGSTPPQAGSLPLASRSERNRPPAAMIHSRVEDCPLNGPRVLAVIATSLVGGVVCGSLIGWFLRSIKCSGRAWLLGSSLTMLRSQPAAIANRALVGWLRRAGCDLVG